MLQFVGDRLTKIDAERSETTERPLAIKTNIEIANIQRKELFPAGEKKQGLVFDYAFKAMYGEKTGKVGISGQIFTIGPEVDLKNIEKEWKKKKKIESDLVVPVLNKALELSYLQVLPLARELKLPVPFRLPRFERKPEEKK